MNHITITGILGRDAELRFTPGGTAVLNMSIAHTPRVKRGDQWEDGETVWIDVAVWAAKAEAVAELNLAKGSVVLVAGQLEAESWTSREGDKRNKLKIRANEVCPVAKANRTAGQGAGWNRDSKPATDPWGGGGDDQAPF